MGTRSFVKGEAGFTLLELLITFALLGLVIASLYSFYLAGLQSWNRSADRVEYQQTARIAMNIIIDEIKYAHRVKTGVEEGFIETGAPSEIVYFRAYVEGVSTRFSFRLNGSQLHIDRRRDRNNSILATNVVALGLTSLDFVVDETGTVHINIEVGEGPEKAVLSGAVRPRNLPCPGENGNYEN